MESDSHVVGWKFKRLTDRYFLSFSLLFILSLILVVVFSTWLAWIFCVLSGLVYSLVIYFFRDPIRMADRDPNICYSPADGKVVDITTVTLDDYPELEFIRIGIFMSVLNVHVQRSPLDGVVDFLSYQPGKNLPAYDPAASVENDQISMGLKSSHGLIIVKQIAGILARKCVNYARIGEEIQSGQRYGLIKFGSRVELFFPADFKIKTSLGELVTAGITPLAETNHA